MHVAVSLAIGVVVTLALFLLAGMSPFIGIPILVVALVFPALWAAISARLAQRRLQSDVPSTREASYDPVSDPADRT